MPKLLVVEDDDAMRELIVEDLEERGYTVLGVPDADGAEAILQGLEIDVLITDLNLLQGHGLSLCRRALSLDPELPVILMTAFGTLDSAIEAIRAGAYEFLTKPFSMDALALALQRAVGLRSLKRELASLRVDARRHKRPSRLDGTSPQVTRLRDTAARLAATDASVLLLGESGSGKEMVAREIHDLSPRAEQAFVAENVAAIPAELLESTLFGHVKGAFTGATTARDGLFRMAHKGTLLLDEIGELPMALQVKLLRVLEEGRVRPLGSDREIPVDVRVLAATHRDIHEAIARHSFREDLYYRLAVVEVAIPALRERSADILTLAQLFLSQSAARLDRPRMQLHHETAARLLSWHWPGNIRELRNVIERAVILSQQPLLLPVDLPERLQHLVPREVIRTHTQPMSLEEVERQHILHILALTEGNKAEAARILGIGRKTLYRKLEAWGVELGQTDTPEPR